jgi:hypothetical protein
MIPNLGKKRSEIFSFEIKTREQLFISLFPFLIETFDQVDAFDLSYNVFSIFQAPAVCLSCVANIAR